MNTANLKHQQYRWTVRGEHCTDSEFCVSGEGFNVLARASADTLFLMVFPPRKLQDPVIGLQIDWNEIKAAVPTAGKHAFEFDASGQYGYLLINGVSVTLKIEDDGLAVDVIDPATEHGEIIRSAYANWADLEFADDDDGVSIIDNLQTLFRSIRDAL